MRRDRRRFTLSAEAEALLGDPEGRWERLELADGPAAQAMAPGIRASGWKPPESTESGPIGDDRDPDTPDLFE